MKNTANNKAINFDNFLVSTLTKGIYDSLHIKLGISKKMLTVLKREPKRLNAMYIQIIMELTGKSFDELKPFIN